MQLELTSGLMAVLVGSLTSHIECLKRDMERPDYPEEHRILTRQAIGTIQQILDLCEQVLITEIENYDRRN